MFFLDNVRYLREKSDYISENPSERVFFMMKKLFVLLMALLLAVSLVACDREGASESDASYSEDLEALLADIYAVGGYSDMLTSMLEAPESTENMFYTSLMTVEITAENEVGFLGANGIPYERAIASEPTMMPTTYSLCLLKVKEGEDVAAVAKQVKKSANPMKWVCTGVSDDDVYVDYADDIVILVMSAKDGEALIGAFRSMMQKDE